MLLPSTALWQALGMCARQQPWGEWEGSQVWASEGWRHQRGVQPVQESLRMRKEKGSLCVIALMGCKQDSPLSRQPLSTVVSMMVGVCGQIPHSHVHQYIPTAQAESPQPAAMGPPLLTPSQTRVLLGS